MASNQIPRNGKCPCGSGRKYKLCCMDKDFEWVESDDGTVSRHIPVSDELRGILQQQADYQIAKHGKLQDRVFHDAPPLEHLEHWTVEAMRKGGIDPALIYAYEKTNGLILSVTNESRVSGKDVADWEAAIDEYEAKTGVKASRRRLNDDDLQAIMKNGPKERNPREMITRLAFRPPFEREEWQSWDMPTMFKQANVKEHHDRCINAAIESGRIGMYIDVFTLMALSEDLPRESEEDYRNALKVAEHRIYSAEEMNNALATVLESGGPEGVLPNSAAAFEFLYLVSDFVRAYAKESGFEAEVDDGCMKVQSLGMLAFIAAINTEFGLQEDPWKGE